MQQKHLYSDQEILDAVLNEGAAGWERFCAQFDPLIQSIVRWPRWRLLEHEQQDVCQNIYLQLQKALPGFKGDSSLSCFIKRIACRQCVNEIRRQILWRKFMRPAIQKTPEGIPNEMEFESPDTLDPHHEVLLQERRAALREALKQLQETCRSSITLFYVQDCSYNEISAQLGISVNTVGSRLSKCLEKLHSALCRQPLFERIAS